jgi:branched-chain amino acid transport system permease protein
VPDVSQAAQLLAGGLAAGTLYALVALGIVLLYRASRVLNFAHGDLATAATFVAFTLMAGGWGFPLASAAALAAAGTFAAGFYLVVLRPAREATLLGRIVVTLGLALVLNGLTTVVWGAETKVFPFPLSDTRVYRLGGVVVSQLSLGLMGAGLVLVAALYLVVQHTRVGLAMRAVAQHVEAAQALGIPARRILAFTWGLAGALGAAAGILTAPATLLDPAMMLDPFLKGFAGAVLGGMDSLPGAVLGGLCLGVLEALFAGYVSVKFKTTFAFLVIVLTLMLRPEGLLGREVRRRA